jgi:multisubunit Na+/H+ antiporter MnhF subunit
MDSEDLGMMKNVMIVGAICYAVLAIVLFYRLIVGPKAADRMLAADAIDNLTCLMLGFYSLYSGRGIYLDIAIVTALLGFISTVFVARYLEGRL